MNKSFIDENVFLLKVKGSEDPYSPIVAAIDQKNVSIYEVENNKQRLIKFYDDHNIFILPSFTEGHPQVLDEALARLRPVIVFDEIKHVKRE